MSADWAAAVGTIAAAVIALGLGGWGIWQAYAVRRENERSAVGRHQADLILRLMDAYATTRGTVPGTPLGADSLTLNLQRAREQTLLLLHALPSRWATVLRKVYELPMNEIDGYTWQRYASGRGWDVVLVPEWVREELSDNLAEALGISTLAPFTPVGVLPPKPSND